MAQKTTILFSNDEKFESNDQVRQFVENSSSAFSTLMIEGELVVIVKAIKGEEQTTEKVRMTAGSIARALSARKVKNALINEKVLTMAFPKLTKAAVITAFVEGWNLGVYKFLTYKSKETAFSTNLDIDEYKNVHTYVTEGEIRAEATSFSRNLMNEVPNILNPETFPKILESEFADTEVNVNVYGEEELNRMEMNGLLAVGRGSTYKPGFVELVYQADKTKPLVALVGKGVTFDTGGISLKGGRNISDMRMDMGGAAAVAGAMKLLEASKANVNVIALIPIVENMPDRKALLPGEVIHYKNGHTVQVGNTDAEGRLILADGLIRAGELGARYVVDIATLTGAIVSALGSNLAGVFGDEELSFKMKKIGDENGDFNWPMPLVDLYDSYLKSDYADFSNISSKGEAGAITAGLFLRRFVPESTKWLHVDMAGLMESQQKGYYSKTATGFGARLLADFTEHVSK